MSPRDLYATLGVHPDASTEEIQAAYTRATQARQTALDDAFRVLSNPETRKAYDLGRTASPFSLLQKTEDVRVPSLLASPFHLLNSVLDPSPVPPRAAVPWGWNDAGPLGLGLFGRMLAPFSDPAPVWSTFDPSAPRALPDPGAPVATSTSTSAPTETEAWGSGKDRGSAPGLFGRLFGTSAPEGAASSSSTAPSSGPDSQTNPRVTSFSRSYFSSNEDGQCRVRAEEVGPDGTKTVYTRDANGETVTVNGVAQAQHPWLRHGPETATITELGEKSSS